MHNSSLSLVFAFSLLLAQNAAAIIQFDFQPAGETHRVHFSENLQGNSLIRSLERITCVSLEVRNKRLQIKASPSFLFVSFKGGIRIPAQTAVFESRHCSSTAKTLLLSAMKSADVYHVKENKSGRLACTSRSKIIMLNFHQIDRIVYRGVPKEVFDVGIIFLHELAHRHLNLTDPKIADIKKDRFIKGEAVTFVNRIERELGLPQRRHYATIKIRYINNRPRWGIYFGNKRAHVELDPHCGIAVN